jgi:DNA invertase Pin-like site-specific DNA recombinase
MPARTKKSPQTSEPQLAYSYIRFSTPEQAKGDSLRRQMQAAADWCARHNVTLDTSTTLHDLGKSAFLGDHRKNPDRHALAAFLKLVEANKVPRGSTLIVESLDRLSREHIRPALTLLLQLIEAGVRVVQLIPVEAIYDDKVEPMQLMMAIMELSRGHSESAVKSERIGAAWAEKKARAREGLPQPEKRQNRTGGMMLLTHKLPAWVEEKGGKLELIPEAAKAVSRVYELARSGYGHQAIAKKLTADKVPPITDNGIWMRSYVAGILSDRRAVGELQPRTRGGAPDGAPILNYYPAVVTEDEWQAARAGASTRRRPGTTKAPANGSIHNLFAGLITDARNGGSYYAVQRADGRYPPKSGEWPRVLINTKSVEGQVPCVSFPVEPFERGILAKLREINPRELLGNTRAPNESAALAAELAAVETAIASIVADMDANGESPTQYKRLREKEARQKELAESLAVARAAEATPVSAAWGEFQTLVDVLDTAKDREDARYRLRGALRRVVSGVWLLAIPLGRTRVAAVRVLFAGCEKARDFLIVYSPPKSNGKATTPASLRVHSFRQRANVSVMHLDKPDTVEFMGLDLRERDDAAKVERVLSMWDVKEPLADLAAKRTTPKDVARWLSNLEGGSELLGIAPSLTASEF